MNYTSGWEDLSCTIDDVRSKNMATIPFSSGVRLVHSPEEFQLNQNYKLICEGFLVPTTKMDVKFYFNDLVIGSIVGGQFMPNPVVPGIVYDNYSTNNSFIFRPTLDTNRGRYYCATFFSIPFSSLTNITSENSWYAGGSPPPPPGNSSIALSSTVPLMLIAAFLSLITNLF